jgi:competence protein J (ComJ)
MEPIEFTIMVSYAQVAVFDRSLERPFNEWTTRHVNQGFSWRPGSVAFGTIEEGGPHLVTVRIDANGNEAGADAIRVIDVPFEAPPDGAVEVGSISDSVSLEIPPGLYQLRFECYARLNRSGPRLRLLFRRDDRPGFDLVRAENDIHPGGDLLLTALPA